VVWEERSREAPPYPDWDACSTMPMERLSIPTRALILSFLLALSSGCLATSSRYVEYFSPSSEEGAIVDGRYVYYHPTLYDEIFITNLGIRMRCDTRRATVLGVGVFIIPPVVPFPKRLGWNQDHITLELLILPWETHLETFPHLGGVIRVSTPEASAVIRPSDTRYGWKMPTQLDPRSTEAFTLDFSDLTFDGKPAGIPQVEFRKRRTLRMFGD
jgi:hypothetical protein